MVWFKIKSITKFWNFFRFNKFFKIICFNLWLSPRICWMGRNKEQHVCCLCSIQSTVDWWCKIVWLELLLSRFSQYLKYTYTVKSIITMVGIGIPKFIQHFFYYRIKSSLVNSFSVNKCRNMIKTISILIKGFNNCFVIAWNAKTTKQKT